MIKETGQLTFETMGGESVTVPVRGRHYTQPRGYMHHPGGGPEGETCGSCKHDTTFRRYHKCALNRGKWTHGRGTDILTRSPACKYWESKQAVDAGPEI